MSHQTQSTLPKLLADLAALGLTPYLDERGDARLREATPGDRKKLTTALTDELFVWREHVIAALRAEPVRRIVDAGSGEILEEWGMADGLSHVDRVKAWRGKHPDAVLEVWWRRVEPPEWVRFLVLREREVSRE